MQVLSQDTRENNKHVGAHTHGQHNIIVYSNVPACIQELSTAGEA